MILVITALLVLYLTFLRFSVAFLNMVSRPYLPELARQKCDLPSLSVLIPVRNEEKNIDRLLGSLISLNYGNAEILVYDDGSTDGSAQLIKGYEALDSRVRYIQGKELPAGWTGKNRACHNLAMSANGDYLLFLDADVTVGYDLLRRAVHFARRHDLTLLSMFPEQMMRTRGEKIVVPFMFRILLSLLPLFLIRRCSWTSFAAANGQMMLFRGDMYRRYYFHEAVKNQLAEDIEIMRLVKREKLRGDTLVGGKEIRCRMYRSYSEGISGFSRNIFSMFGNSILFFLLFSLTGLAGWILFLFLPWYYMAIYIIMILILNAMIAVTSRQRVSENLKYLLPGIAAFYHIAVTAVVKTIRRSYEWKGRDVK
ncbi:MAG: glycosyltransferase family 2 protein [Bacteroidales bacterium]|jgi:chlorobactene glucosyltransferase|nr:glycosyltransferase family 2 protein [Bacteroidales bacterium]